MALSQTEVAKVLSPTLQIMADRDLAWRLQAEEYKAAHQKKHWLTLSSLLTTDKPQIVYQYQKNKNEITSFTLKPTRGDGDCFFHAVDRPGFNREALVQKLLEHATDTDKEVREVFGQEIRQFLYLGNTGVHLNIQENGACQQLLTEEIKQLFTGFQEAEEGLRIKVEGARAALGEVETKGKNSKELLELLQEKGSNLTREFAIAYQAVLSENEAIYQYCCRQEVFEDYVKLYLKEARGYIPFSRDLGRELPKMTMDVINQLFGLNVQVYLSQNRGGANLILANQLQTGEVIPIFHNGVNHFSRLEIKFLENKMSNNLDKSNTKEKSAELPKIAYDRQELIEIIDELKVDTEIRIKINAYLNTIEEKVSEIHRYQSKKKVENFYPSIREALLNIRNTADAIYESTKIYNARLSNTLKQRILKWIEPLEKELTNRLEMSAFETEDLEIKTKHLYAEQSFICRQVLLNHALGQHLEGLQKLLSESNKPAPCCYISYAWPSLENQEKEYWVQPFLTQLCEHLSLAGIRVILDIRDHKAGSSVYSFMKHYHEGNYILLIGTESLLQKHYAETPNTAQTQLSVLFSRFEQDQKQFGQSRLCPMLISGTAKTAYPEYYSTYVHVKDARKQGYLGTLKELIDWIYASRLALLERSSSDLWQAFNQQCPGLSLDAVEAEIAAGYHRQYLNDLKKSTQYQSIEAQETVQYDSTLEKGMIDVLRASQGTNLKKLFDGSGRQFQRPCSNPDFIERQDLWNLISQHLRTEQSIILHGLEGVGKTELAGHYFLHPYRPYSLRAWFNASSRELLYEQYLALAISSGISFLPNLLLEEKMTYVKEWLEKEDCLLVYDNVPHHSVVEGLLPQEGKHHILITSREAIALPCSHLPIDIMQENEAIVLIGRITGYSQEQPYLKELVYHLKLLPAALAQAGYYMATKGVNSDQYWLRYQRYKDYLRSEPKYLPPQKFQNSLQEEDVPTLPVESSTLPRPSYHSPEIQEVIDAISMPSELVVRLKIHLGNIDAQISKTNQYQSRRTIKNFYGAMRTGLLEIRNTAEEIYELVEFFHPNLAEIIRAKIIDNIMPLETRLKDLEDQRENTTKTQSLYAEQSFFVRQPALQQALMEHLEKCKAILAIEQAPRCYINYAWTSKENQAQEYWVQPFLFMLYEHLTQAGIRMMLDIRDVSLGESVYEWMKQYHPGDYLILVGTESLLQKHYAVLPNTLQTALNISLNRTGKNQHQFGSGRIYPMLISGTLKTSYPERYQGYSNVRDARKLGYLGALKDILDWVYDGCLELAKKQQTSLWQGFYSIYPSFSKEPAAIEAELALGYHEKHLSTLKQSSQYQGVEAQEKTPHSQAVIAETISLWMKSHGNNPKPLFEENGQQFQRPYANPDFIERPSLWDKMTEHFATTEQQILTLTAHGLGGMGKTELARRYFLHPPKAYTLRAWFDATTTESLFIQYIDLATSNGMKFILEMPIEEKVTRVKKWLEQKKDCLLIYDNVPKAETITGWLPQQGKHHILITSRNSIDWPAHQKLDVDVMEEEEAIDLIVKITEYSKEEPLLKELVHTLGLLPLALTQASAYMKVKNKTIETYLLEYQQSQESQESQESLESLATSHIDSKHEPVWVTFNMNFECLKEECPAALETLKQASWLNQTAIPEVLLFLMINSTDDKPRELLWDDVKENLRRYSLMHVDIERLQLSVHPLLQDIFHSKQEKKEQIYLIEKLCDCLDAIHHFIEAKNKTQKMLLLHAECLHNHVQNVVHLTEVVNETEIPQLFLKPACLEELYFNLGLTRKTLPILKQKQKIYERYFGKDNIETVPTLINLGSAFLKLEDTKVAKIYLKSALKIQEKYYEIEHVEIAKTLVNLGSVYLNLEKRIKAKNYYEKALKIKKNYYGVGHPETVKVLINLGSVCMDLEDAEAAKEYLEHALSIQWKYYKTATVDTVMILINLSKIYIELGVSKTARTYLEMALNEQKNYYEEDHIEMAITLTYLGNVYIDLGITELARTCLERALKIKEKHYGIYHAEIGNVLVILGTIYNKLGMFEKVEECCKNILNIQKNNSILSDIEMVRIFENLSVVYAELENFSIAKEYLEHALKTQERSCGADHIKTASVLINLGKVNLKLKEIEEAKKCYEKALEIEKKYYGVSHIKTTSALQGLGCLYLELGKFGIKEYLKAEEYLKSTLEIQKIYYGLDHVKTADVLIDLGNVYLDCGNIKKAEEYYRNALKIKKTHYGENHIEITSALGNIGVIFMKSGEFSIAEGHLECTLKIQEKFYGMPHIKMADVLINLGNVYLGLRNIEKAKEYYEKALEIEKKHYGINHIKIASALGSLSCAYLELKNFSGAEEYLECALKIQEKFYGKDHVEIALTLINLGTVNLNLMQFKIANKYYKKALAIQESYYGKDNRETALTLMNTGIVYLELKKKEKAKYFLKHSQRIYRRDFHEDHPNLSFIKNLLQKVFLEDLEILKQESVELAEQGIKHYKAQAFDKALSFFREALNLQQKANNQPNETLATLHFNMGSTLILQKNYSSAQTHLKSAYDIRLKLLGPNHLSIEKTKERLQECEVKIQTLATSFLNNEFKLTPYTLQHKIPIEDTSLIDHLKAVTQLTFRGVRDKDYQVDAIVNVEDDSTLEQVKLLQKDLKIGLFFQYHSDGQTRKAFVLEGINLPEGNPSKGEQIRTYLLQKSSKI